MDASAPDRAAITRHASLTVNVRTGTASDLSTGVRRSTSILASTIGRIQRLVESFHTIRTVGLYKLYCWRKKRLKMVMEMIFKVETNSPVEVLVARCIPQVQCQPHLNLERYM